MDWRLRDSGEIGTRSMNEKTRKMVTQKVNSVILFISHSFEFVSVRFGSFLFVLGHFRSHLLVSPRFCSFPIFRSCDCSVPCGGKGR